MSRLREVCHPFLHPVAQERAGCPRILQPAASTELVSYLHIEYVMILTVPVAT